jgi:hypothetical protein
VKKLIGIDPDVQKSGVAIWEGKKLVSLHSLPLADLVRFLQSNPSDMIIIEAGWMNGGNWHIAPGMPAKKVAAMGADVGANHQICKDIGQICAALNLPYKFKQPSKNNLWKTNAKLFQQITRWTGQSNPETRDAAMIAYSEI